jgi:hypothetical protein
MQFIQFRFRRGTASEWSTANTILSSGEMGIETDTKLFKIGDANTSWNNLQYGGIKGDIGSQGFQGAQGVGFQGAQGFQGSGTQGNQGFQGFQGAQGAGFQGAQGFQGALGFQGAQGNQGSGAQGNQGFQGAQGAGFQGSRLETVGSSTTWAVNVNSYDVTEMVMTGAAGTLLISNPTGTPLNAQKLIYRIQSTFAQTLNWGSIFQGSTDLSLPGSTSGNSKWDIYGFMYNSTSSPAKWQLVAKVGGF